MTVKITEVTREDRATFGMRLKNIRERKELTRADISDRTGIPVRSVEKFEQGLMSPNVERLQVLAEVLNVSVSHLLDGEEPDTEEVAKLTVTNESNEVEAETDDFDDGDDFDQAVDQLAHLDDMRKEGFQHFWRKAPRAFQALEELLFGWSYDDVLDLAEMRGVMAIPQDEIDQYEELEPEVQIELSDELTARIMDTAYFGLDLYKIKTRHLEELADDLDLERDSSGIIFASWSGETAIIQALRPTLRRQFLAGDCTDFQNEETFPKKEGA